MTFDECFENWVETGDTHYECVIGDTIIELHIDNVTGGVKHYTINGVDINTENGESLINYIYPIVFHVDEFDGWTRW